MTPIPFIPFPPHTLPGVPGIPAQPFPIPHQHLQQHLQHQQYPPQQIPPPISPKQDPQQALIQQIDYYFSLENLIKDLYLRKNMDNEGWVNLKLILDFKRVKIIINGLLNGLEKEKKEGEEKEETNVTTTTNDNYDKIILESIKSCQNLEINYGKEIDENNDVKLEDVKLRVKDNYQQWLVPDN